MKGCCSSSCIENKDTLLDFAFDFGEGGGCMPNFSDEDRKAEWRTDRVTSVYKTCSEIAYPASNSKVG